MATTKKSSIRYVWARPIPRSNDDLMESDVMRKALEGKGYVSEHSARTSKDRHPANTVLHRVTVEELSTPPHPEFVRAFREVRSLADRYGYVYDETLKEYAAENGIDLEATDAHAQ